MTAHPDPHEELDDLSADRPMDDARCLRVLSLLTDGRPVDAELARAARAWAAARPGLAAQERDWRIVSQLLASDPPRATSPGFAERVAARVAASRPVRPSDLPPGTAVVWRRLAVAAALVVAALLALEIAQPPTLHADDARELRRHAVDGFRATPWEADDIEAGLRARLADPDFRPGPLGPLGGSAQQPVAPEAGTGAPR